MNLSNILTDLMKIQTYIDLKKYYMILIFYFFVIFITSTIGYIVNKIQGFTYGMIFGFVISMILWYQYGRKMVY